MTSLSMIGARIAEKKARHAKKAEEWAARLDVLDEKEPGLFARGDHAVATAETDISGFEDDIVGLGSNLPPLPPSGDGSSKG